jgi:ketosteroid isomerase-like protein
MATHAENVAKLQDAYRQWHESKGKSVQAWVDLVADNVRLRSLADGRPGVDFTREVRSKDEFMRYFTGLLGDWEMIHYTTDVFLVDGDRVVMRGSTAWKNRKTGRVVETRKADFVTFHEGKIVEFDEFYDTAAMMAALQP